MAGHSPLVTRHSPCRFHVSGFFFARRSILHIAIQPQNSTVRWKLLDYLAHPVLPCAVNSRLYPRRSLPAELGLRAVACGSVPVALASLLLPCFIPETLPPVPLRYLSALPISPLASRRGVPLVTRHFLLGVAFFCRFLILFFSATYKPLFPQLFSFLIYTKRPGCGLRVLPLARPLWRVTRRFATFFFLFNSLRALCHANLLTFLCFQQLTDSFLHIQGVVAL